MEDRMGINWKIRFKNPMFYIQLAMAVIAPVLAYMGLTARDITTWAALGNVLLGAVSNPYILLTAAISVYNAVIDPTSTGITDSAKARLYRKPNNVK